MVTRSRGRLAAALAAATVLVGTGAGWVACEALPDHGVAPRGVDSSPNTGGTDHGQ